jgi:Cyclin, N-terminal domain
MGKGTKVMLLSALNMLNKKSCVLGKNQHLYLNPFQCHGQPREIRAIEKRIKEDQRRLDEAFFREMERNLLASLARGECVPLSRQEDEMHVPVSSQTVNSDGPLSIEDIQSLASDTKLTSNDGNDKTGRVRTISCMNEHLLAQLQQPLHLQRVSSSGISKSFEGRPPLPSRPPLSSTILAAPGPCSSSINNNSNFGIDTQTVALGSSESRHFDNDLDEFEKNYYFTAVNDDFDDLRLSPEESQRKQQIPGTGPSQDDTLRGEDLLDGALMLADVDVSDEEDGHDKGKATLSGNVKQGISRPDMLLGTPRVEVVTSSGISSNPISPKVTKSKKVDSNGLAPLSHIRRNTAGAVPPNVKGGTMEKPDIDATIHVVCGVIRAHIEQSLQYHNRPVTAPPYTVNINLDVFRDDYELSHNDAVLQPQRKPQKRVSMGALPSLEEIKKFYREFYQRSQMECDAIIMSLIYVERLIKTTNGAVMPTPYNWASVVFSCMILASKVWDDLSMWNVDFSNVSVNSGVLSSFSLKRINELELAILACLNFAVAIPGSEYAKYYYLLRSMMIRGGLLDPFVANQRLSTDTTSRLEDRTTHYQDSILLHSDSDSTRRRVRSVDWSTLTNLHDKTAPLPDDILLGKPSQESAKVQ